MNHKGARMRPLLGAITMKVIEAILSTITILVISGVLVLAILS